MYCKNCGEKITQNDLFCGKCGKKTNETNSDNIAKTVSSNIAKTIGGNNKFSFNFNNKLIITGIVFIVAVICFFMFRSSNSFEFKTEDVKFSYSEGAFAIGEVEKGTLTDGDIVTIKRDGKTIRSVKVDGIGKADDMKELKSASKGDKIYIGLGDIEKSNISINDTIVKEK